MLTALTKLAGRLGEDQEDAIEALLQTYSGSMNLELQVQYGVEQTLCVRCRRLFTPIEVALCTIIYARPVQIQLTDTTNIV